MKPNLMTITEASHATGRSKQTIFARVRANNILPLECVGKQKYYNKDEIFRIAQRPLIRHEKPRTIIASNNKRKSCSRCGGLDSGNWLRGGLCLDCWCHDYCSKKGI